MKRRIPNLSLPAFRCSFPRNSASAIGVHVGLARPPKENLRWIDKPSSPGAEARTIRTLIDNNGDTIEDLRELIEVPPEIEALLRAFARAYPEEGREIEMGLRFRERVLGEFERMAK
jgi:hypothetical protein